MDKEKMPNSKKKNMKKWLKQHCFCDGDLDITDLMERINRPLSEDISADKAFFLLSQSEEWQQMDEKTDSLFDEFYPFNYDKTEELFDAVAMRQAMYGDACYMAGLKDGIGFMLWALGEKQARLYGMTV